jgi:hypothetical protein
MSKLPPTLSISERSSESTFRFCSLTPVAASKLSTYFSCELWPSWPWIAKESVDCSLEA